MVDLNEWNYVRRKEEIRSKSCCLLYRLFLWQQWTTVCHFLSCVSIVYNSNFSKKCSLIIFLTLVLDGNNKFFIKTLQGFNQEVLWNKNNTRKVAIFFISPPVNFTNLPHLLDTLSCIKNCQLENCFYLIFVIFTRFYLSQLNFFSCF